MTSLIINARKARPLSWSGVLTLCIYCGLSGLAVAQQADGDAVQEFVSTHCLECHSNTTKSGSLSLEDLDFNGVRNDSATWEKVVHRLQVRQMPPAGHSRPDEKSYQQVIAVLEQKLDVVAAEYPRPGRTDSLRRLNRTEYQNSIRDLLALEVDVASLLPADESGHGFDNVTVGDLSPTLLNRYLLAAQKISRLAVGTVGKSPDGETFRIRPDLTQEEHVEGLPIGTRGGALISYTFPQDGEYEIQARLTRDRNEEVEGLNRRHELEMLLDGQRIGLFDVEPPPDRQDFSGVDAHLKARVTVKAGRRQLGVTFVKQPSSLLETKRQPLNSHFNMHRHPRISPAIYQVSLTGPYQAVKQSPENSGGGTNTASRQRIFVLMPETADDEDHAAEVIVKNLLQRAYRRPIDEHDVQSPMTFFREGKATGFESGIESALTSILVNPNFLFRIEQDPADIAPETAYRISGVELASRLSFFLWSSAPDNELLELAIRGELNHPEVLEQQTRRLLADSRSKSLASNFAGQWLYLRNLESITPDARLFPDFDDNLRQAFRKETELLFENVQSEDRSVFDLVKADYTFLNERLAKHYGIPHIYGSRFRRVSLTPESRRGGLLRHGSILTVTSYATRTSPVLRGHWILKNLIGAPPGPPPSDVPALKEVTVSDSLSVRDRLSEHRANAACASCHNLMDPLGFALENFDAVGRWRDLEGDHPIDASGEFANGTKFTDVSGLEAELLQRPELFVRTMAEKLLTFALGRGIESSDGPALRRVVRDAAVSNYRFSSVIIGIVKSEPFQMRTSR